MLEFSNRYLIVYRPPLDILNAAESIQPLQNIEFELSQSEPSTSFQDKDVEMESSQPSPTTAATDNKNAENELSNWLFLCADLLNITHSFLDKKQPIKKNCCLFCQKHVAKIVRHLESVHGLETRVREMCSLPKGKRVYLKII